MASQKEKLNFPELRPREYQVRYRIRGGDPLAEARIMTDQRLVQIVGIDKVDSREKARALLALTNEFSDLVHTLARKHLNLARTIEDDGWEVEKGLWQRLFIPLSYANRVPWIETDFMGFGTPVEKAEQDNGDKNSAGIKRIYKHSTSVSPFNLDREERAHTPCLFECLSYGSKDKEGHLGLMMTLLTATTPLDAETPATIRLIHFYAISSTDPFYSEVATTYNEAGRGCTNYIGVAGRREARGYREILRQLGFISEGEVPKSIDFETVWRTFLRNAGSQTFIHPIEYLA